MNSTPTSHCRRRILLSLLVLLPAMTFAAPVPISGTSSYTQNFNGLGTASVAWVNDATIPGWYAQINNGVTATGAAQAADGNTVLSGLLSLGSSGAADRALGSKATGTGGFANIACGVLFQNTGIRPLRVTQITYTGELWRTNSTTGGLAETYTVFASTSASPIANLFSGGTSSTAVAGAGYTAVGISANWNSPTNTPVAAALDGNAAANRTAVSSGTTSIQLTPGSYLMLKWTDTNLAGTDGFQGLDDLTVEFTELNGLVQPVVTNKTRDLNGTPADLNDDTFGFTVTVAGSGTDVGSGWTTTGVQPPAANASSAAYGTPVVWTGFPVAGSKTVTITDNSNASFSASITVDPPAVIGLNQLTAPAGYIVLDASPALWMVDQIARAATLTNGGSVLQTAPVDLTATSGFVRLSVDIQAVETSTGSNFETEDTVLVELHLREGANPEQVINMTQRYDANASGRMNGYTGIAYPAAVPPITNLDNYNTNRGLDEFNAALVDGAASLDSTFPLFHDIPDNFTSAYVVVLAANNSAGESFIIKNLRVETSPPALYAAVAGPSVVDHYGTSSAADDTFTVPVNVTPVFLSPSTGWTSNQPPPASGLYSTANPVTFGPYLVSGGSRTATLADGIATGVTASVSLFPPVPALTLGAPANITRHANSPGLADDTVSFDLIISGANGGPGWSTSGATPATGAYGPVTFTVPATVSRVSLTFTDVSYPSVSQTLLLHVPGPHVIGTSNFGGAFAEVVTSAATPSPVDWTVDSAARTLDMTVNALVVEQVILSEALDLTAVGAVNFAAVLRAREISDTSNFETTDRFKAELIIDGSTVVNLVTPYDTGNGAPSTFGTGLNGPPDGYLNGYQGNAGTDVITGTVYANGIADYHTHVTRDEFNLTGQNVAAFVDTTFPLTYLVPASTNTVQLRLSGTLNGGTATEFFTVSGITFSTGTPGNFAIGTQFYGGAVADVTTPSLESEWAHDPAQRSLTMTNANATADKIVSSAVIDLTALGTVHLSAVLRARETGTTSNFETSDRCKVELIVDGSTVVNLIAPYDTGNGVSALGGVPNGPPDGYLNGYQGTAGGGFATALLEYNANKARDEFNRSGANGNVAADHKFPLIHTIPASANSVQLRLTGAGTDASEFFTLYDVLFTTSIPTTDTDGDGTPDLQEFAEATAPNDALSVFTLTDVTPHPTLPGVANANFPTVTGRLYRGYYSNNLVTWVRDDANASITGNGSPALWPLVPFGERRYLKLVIGREPADFPPALP